jgi:integrase
MAGYRQALKPVVQVLGARRVQQLTRRDIDLLVPQLTQGSLRRADGRPMRPWQPRTVNLMLFALGKVINDVVAQGHHVRNVARLVDRLPAPRPEMSTYSAAEVKKVLACAAGDPLECAWHLALYGLRRGEICGLRWSDVNLDQRTLSIAETNVSVDGKATKSTPKSDRGVRRLPITPVLAAVLDRTRQRQTDDQAANPDVYRTSGYLIVNSLGQRLHPDTVSDKWDLLVRRAGVRRIRLHDARHTCGTLMHLEGVPVAVIAAWLGHADAAFTMRTYIHSQDDALRAAAGALGSVTHL